MADRRGLAAGLVEHVEQFRKRVVQDALAEATAQYWLHRAEVLEAAAPQPTDFIGRTTAEEREVRRQRLLSMAVACRHRAELALVKEVAR